MIAISKWQASQGQKSWFKQYKHRPYFELEKLPSDLKQRVACFLSTKDLLNLRETSKSVSSDLNISVASSPFTDRASHGQYYRTKFYEKCFAVVIPKSERTYSMTFTCGVTLYGGVYNTEVAVVEHYLPKDQEDDADFLQTRYQRRGKEIVRIEYTKRESKVSLSFNVKPGKFYQFYVRTDYPDFSFLFGHEAKAVLFSHMTLHRVGFGVHSTQYKAYQFDVFEEQTHQEFDGGYFHGDFDGDYQ